MNHQVENCVLCGTCMTSDDEHYMFCNECEGDNSNDN
jgi:hypothetical protein